MEIVRMKISDKAQTSFRTKLNQTSKKTFLLFPLTNDFFHILI